MSGKGNCPGFGFKAGPVVLEAVLNIALGSSWGNQTLLFPLSPKRPACQGIPCSQIVLKPDPTFKALILNECCVAGQIPQACLGSPGRTRCALRGCTGSQRHPSNEKTKRKQDTEREGARFSISFLAWGPLSTWSPSIREVESIKRKATPSLFYLPKGTLSFSLLFYASLCSHHLFSLKG